jgi:peroxiredoxin
MRIEKKGICLSVILLLLYGFSWSKPIFQGDEIPFGVSLKLNEDIVAWMGYFAVFDEKEVKKLLEERPVRIPSEYLNEYKLGFTIDRTYILYRKQNEGRIELIIDRNRDDDFSGDEPVILEPEGSVTVKILREYEHLGQVWLPCLIRYLKNQDTDLIHVLSHYRAESLLEMNQMKYLITLWDMNCNGKFNDDYRYGTNFSIDLNGDGKIFGKNEYYKSSELIPVGKDFFEISEIKEDGSYISFTKSELRHVKVGEQAPDFELVDNRRRKFNISDLKGNVVVMNFWASWCKPCIEKFPEIRKLYEKYNSESFEFLGINTDAESKLKEARELIKKYDFSWPQVMIGSPDYSPFWRSYSRISEGASSVSLIVVIDKSGIVRYANDTNKTLEEIKHILEEIK